MIVFRRTSAIVGAVGSASRETIGSFCLPRVSGGHEVLDRPRPALEAGSLDAVDRERQHVALLVRVRHVLVGHPNHEQVGLLALDVGRRDARRLVLGPGAELEVAEVVAREGVGALAAARAVAELAVQRPDLHEARPLRLRVHVGQRVDELGVLDELHGRRVALRRRASRSATRSSWPADPGTPVRATSTRRRSTRQGSPAPRARAPRRAARRACPGALSTCALGPLHFPPE